MGWSHAEDGSSETTKSHAWGRDGWGCQKTRSADKDLVGWRERRSEGAWTVVHWRKLCQNREKWGKSIKPLKRTETNGKLVAGRAAQGEL